jgi:hypothetical protein
MQRHKKPATNRLAPLFAQVIENASNDIFKFLERRDLAILKQVNRQCYYTLMSYSVWSELILCMRAEDYDDDDN